MSEKKQNTSEKSDADKIWESIKDLKIEMFALPNQTVSQYCKPVSIEPSKCYLVFTASAVLPALEEATKSKFAVDRAGKFITVSYPVPEL